MENSNQKGSYSSCLCLSDLTQAETFLTVQQSVRLEMAMEASQNDCEEERTEHTGHRHNFKIICYKDFTKN